MKKRTFTACTLLLSMMLTAGCTTAIETTVQQSEQTKQAQAAQQALTHNVQQAQTQNVTSETGGNNHAAPNTSAPASNIRTTPEAKYYVDNKVFFIRPVDSASTEKIALLTFDDGPKGDSTLKLLDTLDKYNAKAIWFISGFNYGSDYKADPNKADKFKQLVLEIRKRGHVIGNHTWQHHNLKQIPADKQRQEITEMNNLLESITGEKPKFIRPPFGSYTDVLKDETLKQGMQWMNWSVGSLDWEHRDPQKVVQQTVSTIHNGANILMHDNDVEVQALEGILQELSAKGYKFVVPTEVRSE